MNRNRESEEKWGGGPQTREEWCPCVNRVFRLSNPRTARPAWLSYFAIFLTIRDFARVKRAAFFCARVAVGAAVSSTDGAIWGVSDPLCHPPITAPCFSW